jgi:hypothetical protein
MESNQKQQDPIGSQDSLERKYILEYLGEKGFCLRDLLQLSEQEARQLMTEACCYASLKLAEIEIKANFLRKIEYVV